jgi:hypothetical protein
MFFSIRLRSGLPILFYFCFYCLTAQTEYRPGYVITKKQDTLFGALDYRSDAIMSKRCRLQKGVDIKDFSPEDIKGFRFEDGKYFVSRSIDGEQFFLQYLVKGKLDIFSLHENSSGKSIYYVQNDRGDFKALPYEESILDTDANRFFKETQIHKGILSLMTADAPVLRNQINKMNKPTQQRLIRLAKDYHKAVCDTESCIVFEEKKRKVKFALEYAVSWFNYSDYIVENYVADTPVLFQGVLAHISIPSMGDKWYVRTGFLVGKETAYTNTQWTDGTSLTNFKIPLQLEYIHYKGNIKPKLAYGVVLHENRMLSSFNAGFQYHFTEKLAVSLRLV